MVVECGRVSGVIVGIGADVVLVPRFEAALRRRSGLGARLFSTPELSRPDGTPLSAASLAARFAAKEAVAKVLGAPAGMQWHDCRVLADDAGTPRLEVVGTVAAVAAAAGITRWHVSLSHDGDYALAYVIGEA